jgi:hypothetical protein
VDFANRGKGNLQAGVAAEEDLRRFEKSFAGEGLAFITETAGCFISHETPRTGREITAKGLK